MRYRNVLFEESGMKQNQHEKISFDFFVLKYDTDLFQNVYAWRAN